MFITIPSVNRACPGTGNLSLDLLLDLDSDATLKRFQRSQFLTRHKNTTK